MLRRSHTEQAVVGAHEGMFTAGPGRDSQRGLAPGYAFVQRGGHHNEVINGCCMHGGMVPVLWGHVVPRQGVGRALAYHPDNRVDKLAIAQPKPAFVD